MKNQYNKYYIFLLLNSEDFVTLKLHHEYHVSDVKNKKLFIQQVDHFFIKWWISLLAYELKLALSGPTRKPDPTWPEPGQDPASGAHSLKSIPGGLVGF